MAEDVKSKDTGASGGTTAAGAENPMALGLRLQAVNNSDHPIYSNFAVVQATPGTLFLDFGFLEPGALPSLARLAQSGGKLPQSINGRLACRVALSVDAAAQLVQQLQQHLKKVPGAGAGAVAGKPGKATN